LLGAYGEMVVFIGVLTALPAYDREAPTPCHFDRFCRGVARAQPHCHRWMLAHG